MRRRTIGEHPLHPESLAMSYGHDPMLSEGSIKAPIFQTSTFVFSSAAAGKDLFAQAYGLKAPVEAEVPGLTCSLLGPIFQHPLRFGADLVLYSATKFIGGLSDLIAGAAVGSKAARGPVRVRRTFLGTMASPWGGWLMLRSLETLKMRVTAAMKNARHVAIVINDHPRVAAVRSLGSLSEDDSMVLVYRRQCSAPGSMVAFGVVGGEAEAFRFLCALQMINLAVSLGGTESLAEHPASMTHADVPPAEQLSMGNRPAMVRLLVGVEHDEDIIADLTQALEAV